MSNFKFLHTTWPEIYREAHEAEQLMNTSPKACAIICRSAMDKTINWLYDNDADLERPYDTKLAALMFEQCFKDILKPSMFREINLIRKIGNNAAHGTSIKQEEALVCIKNLYRFLCFLAIYYAEEEPEIKPFDEGLIPGGKLQKETYDELQQIKDQLQSEKDAQHKAREKLQQEAELLDEVRKKLEAQQHEIKKRREQRAEVHNIDEEVPLLVSERQTRTLYIDQSLKEAGWEKLRDGYELEFEVKGMPKSTNSSGVGYVDYVLWGDNGKPLAVVEAKKTMADPRKGKHQAKLYADCLEQMEGQRPLIYYTNGFETYYWDDQFYPAREVSGFYTKDELQLAIDRRSARKDLRHYKVNKAIAGRYYQMEAVQRVAENFAKTDNQGKLSGGSRSALLVMATGSGKTRTAISIVDMMTKCNWAKRVLFLADRNALVSQAKRSFSELLPHLSAIDLTREREDESTRLVFSTYPTMMNKIDAIRSKDYRFYGTGHFDLIIVDEAHRSVYQKYGAIFDYFDALLIGLTATPKDEIDRNTYELFEIEDNIPTYAYELTKAVKDKYLTPPKTFNIPLKFPRDGIRYADLNEREKKEYEEKFKDEITGEIPEEVGGEALNKWLFNTSTVDKALEYLMENGLKVQGGDKLGKTIIFATNHKHALFIEERFNKLFPELKGDFLKVIDNYESKAQDLLERFCDTFEEQDPQIAVSVDMMDTGVDAPRVVNLMFFKMVRSLSKFWQMVGRGTRLSPDLFGPGMDKEYFIIFDLCENMKFFGQNPQGTQGHKIKSLTQQIFELKLDVLTAIRNAENASDEEREVAEHYAETLYSLVTSVDERRFVVKGELRYVVEFSNKKRWQNLSKSDVLDIKEHLSKLILPDNDDDELARRFDVLILSIQWLQLTGKEPSGKAKRVSNIARSLTKKQNIPDVGKHIKLIEEVQSTRFWERVNAKRLEEVRVSLRDLIKFIDRDQKQDVYTTFEDEIGEVSEASILYLHKNSKPYRDRVETYIRKHKNHFTIQKLRRNEPITEAELEELEKILFDNDHSTKEKFEKELGDLPLGRFIRSIVGLDINAAKSAFAEFIQKGDLSADQITFIDNIIEYLERNGVIEPSMLFEAPFTYMNDQGLLGVFDEAEAHKVISIIERINDNAGVA